MILTRCQAKQLDNHYFETVGEHMFGRLKRNYCVIFRENSAAMRRAFFQEPLIQLLWPRFLKKEGYKIKSYLETLAPIPRDTLLRDVQIVQMSLSFPVFEGLAPFQQVN